MRLSLLALFVCSGAFAQTQVTLCEAEIKKAVIEDFHNKIQERTSYWGEQNARNLKLSMGTLRQLDFGSQTIYYQVTEGLYTFDLMDRYHGVVRFEVNEKCSVKFRREDVSAPFDHPNLTE